MARLDLTGLTGYHPLGFLAACGVLRCATAEGYLDAQLAWKRPDDGSGWIATFHAANADLDELVAVLIARAKKQQQLPALTWSAKIDDPSGYKQLGSALIACADAERDDESLAFLPALASDLIRTRKNRLQPTWLDLTSGAQRFLSSIRRLSVDLCAGPSVSQADAFREALCGPWKYRDDAHSMGWDPQMQRLHALRHRLPEKDEKNRCVRGAVFLASQALPLFPCFAVGGKLRTTCVHRDGEHDWFAWPIWGHPIGIDTLRSLLGQALNRDLQRRGVELAYRCRIEHSGGSEGNYRVFGNAEEVFMQ